MENIIDILGITDKGNQHSDYKLRPIATFIYIINRFKQLSRVIPIMNITINDKFIAGLASVAFFTELRLISNIFLFPAKPPQSSCQCYLSHEECDSKVTFIPISRIPKPGKSSAHRTRMGERYTIILKYLLALTK